MKKLYQTPLTAYQYISRLFPASCRYYPSCSEYAKWQFECNRADKAFAQTTLRILRCNQLFDGGIDYPIISYKAPSLLELVNHNFGTIRIRYWFVPKNKQQYYIIKDYHAYNT